MGDIVCRSCWNNDSRHLKKIREGPNPELLPRYWEQRWYKQFLAELKATVKCLVCLTSEQARAYLKGRPSSDSGNHLSSNAEVATYTTWKYGAPLLSWWYHELLGDGPFFFSGGESDLELCSAHFQWFQKGGSLPARLRDRFLTRTSEGCWQGWMERACRLCAEGQGDQRDAGWQLVAGLSVSAQSRLMRQAGEDLAAHIAFEASSTGDLLSPCDWICPVCWVQYQCGAPEYPGTDNNLLQAAIRDMLARAVTDAARPQNQIDFTTVDALLAKALEDQALALSALGSRVASGLTPQQVWSNIRAAAFADALAYIVEQLYGYRIVFTVHMATRFVDRLTGLAVQHCVPVEPHALQVAIRAAKRRLRDVLTPASVYIYSPSDESTRRRTLVYCDATLYPVDTGLEMLCKREVAKSTNASSKMFSMDYLRSLLGAQKKLMSSVDGATYDWENHLQMVKPGRPLDSATLRAH